MSFLVLLLGRPGRNPKSFVFNQSTGTPWARQHACTSPGWDAGRNQDTPSLDGGGGFLLASIKNCFRVQAEGLDSGFHQLCAFTCCSLRKPWVLGPGERETRSHVLPSGLVPLSFLQPSSLAAFLTSLCKSSLGHLLPSGCPIYGKPSIPPPFSKILPMYLSQS